MNLIRRWQRRYWSYCRSGWQTVWRIGGIGGCWNRTAVELHGRGHLCMGQREKAEDVQGSREVRGRL